MTFLTTAKKNAEAEAEAKAEAVAVVVAAVETSSGFGVSWNDFNLSAF